MSDDVRPVRKWGNYFHISEEMLADTAVDVDAFIAESIKASARHAGYTPIEDTVEVSWPESHVRVEGEPEGYRLAVATVLVVEG